MKRIVLTLVLAASLCLTTAGAAHADPVSMIAAVMVTALGEGAAIAVATFIVNTAIYAATSLGITAVTSALSGKNKAGIAERQASVTSLSLGELPRELLIGEICTAGTLVDGFNFGGKYGTDTVTRCVAVADHAIDSVVGYYVDDQFYPWLVDGIQPGFSNKLSIRFYNATVDGHAPQAHVLAAGAGWTNADRLAGIAVFWIDTQYDEKIWSQGHPQIKFVLRGIRAYDMRFDPAYGYTGSSPQTWENRSSHTYTRNAAILRYAFTRGIFAEGHHGDPNYLLIGRGLTPEEAPPERIIAAANLCDETVNGQARYTANGVIRAADDFITVEEMFAAAMAGQIVQREGGVEIEPGQAKAAVVTITDGDLVTGEPVSFSAFLPDTDGGRINTVVPRYVSPAQNWKDHAGPVRRDPAHIIADGGPREVTLPLVLVTSGDQADRCAEITRLLARLERRASIVLPPEFATLEEGDWIAWQSARHHGGATVRYRIESWSLDEKWRQHLSLREIASSVFGAPDPIEDTAKVPPAPVPLDALSLDGVSAEAITLPGDTSTMPAVRFHWDTPVDASVSAIRAEVRRVGQTEPSTGRSEDISLGAMVMSNGVPADATIEARLVPVGDPSRPVLPTPWFTLSTTALKAGDVSSASPTIGLINDAVAAANSAVASLNATVNTAGTGLVARTDAMYADINTATTGLKARTDSLLASLNTPTTGVLSRLTVLESSSSGEGSALATRVSSLEATVNTDGTGVTARLATAESAIASNNSAATSRLSALEATVNTAGTGLSARTTSLETATANLSTGKADASSLATTNATVSGLAGTVSAQGTRLTTAEADIAGKASTSSVTSLQAEVTAGRGTAGSLSGRFDQLFQIVIDGDAGKANASDLTALGVRVTSAEGVNTAQNTRLSTAEADIAGKASSSSLLALTSRVSTVEGDLNTVIGTIYATGSGLAPRLISAESSVTSLQTTTASLSSGKANASDLTALAARVTSTEGVNSAQNSRLNTAEADILGKASASSLTTLQAEVVAGRGGNTTLDGRFNQLYSIVIDADAGKADASRVASLEATINTAGTGLSARVVTVEAATVNAAAKLAEARLVIMAEASGGRPAIFGLYSDSRGTSAISLNAAKIYFGDNTTFDDATDTIQTVWSGARKVIAWGAPFGPDSLTEWEGADGIGLSSMTKANARFWRSPVAPYFGSVALTGPFIVNVPGMIVRTVVGGTGTITTAALVTSFSGATGSVSWTWTNNFGDPDVAVFGSSTGAPTFSANPVGVSRKQAVVAWSATDSGTGVTRYGTTAVTIQRDA